MPVVFGCPGCGQRISVPWESWGARVRCPSCGRVTAIDEREVIVEGDPVGDEPDPVPVSPALRAMERFSRRASRAGRGLSQVGGAAVAIGCLVLLALALLLAFAVFLR